MAARILIVEDEQITATDLAAKLRKLGMVVVGNAASGEEAISLAETYKPDVVLMDIRLQGRMSGIEAAAAIQKKTSADVIYLTSYAALVIRDNTVETEPVRCLSKPFSHVQLQSALNDVLKNRGSSDANTPVS